ncbi:peptidase dimerization domain protein [Sphingobium chlorophenolicum L-1]|uniref:Peptidase dimerization domain protein n=1 Tax=Sphingobium chlorophenolicum L-1 TaxID=690566 RepID=F6F0C2_SPHCR|nr:hydrolase [Sphingobium chlorophenolicum]AEG48507.1 peptidase dimerization domain protein [Sphingobium chlorophenolicum L-1]
MRGISSFERGVMENAADASMLARTEKWAGVNSGSRNLPGLATMAAMLADAFSGLPGAISLVDPDPVEAVRPDGRLDLIAHGSHLRLSVRPQAPVQILLTGHMDTVFPADHAFQTLRWIDPATLNGPGVADMKGGLAVMLAALSAFETAPGTERLGYDVIINSDEEVGSPSSAALLRQVAAGKLAAFTYEPALPDGTLAGARAGSGNFAIIVTGKSAHAGRNPQDGRNALLAAADLALRLKAGSNTGLSCNPARIEGGSPNNVVPDHAVLHVNFRPKTPADEQAADILLKDAMAQVARNHDVTLHRHGGFGRPPKPMDSQAEALFRLVQQCGADLSLPIAWRDTGGVCDGNNIAACGVPVVDTMGVRGGDIHSDSEYLIVDSLAERAQLSALALLRIAEGRFTKGMKA